jgi:hypothetical protein
MPNPTTNPSQQANQAAAPQAAQPAVQPAPQSTQIDLQKTAAAIIERGQQAHQALLNHIFWPTFWQKCAELGIKPQSQAEGDLLVKMAYQVLDAREKGLLQGPAATVNPIIKAASQQLDAALGQQPGLDQAFAQEEAWVKIAADYFASQPGIGNAVVDWAQALAVQQQAA